MLNLFRIFRSHGKQFVPDLRKAELPGIFRGRPVIRGEISPDIRIRLANCCPVGAIGKDDSRLDLGRCVFCGECAFSFPEVIRFTNDYRLAANCREGLLVEPGKDKQVRLDKDKVRPEIRTLFRHAFKLRQISAGGDNSAEMELNAAGNVNFDMGRYGIEFVASPRHADGIVITGPISENMAEALRICYEATPSPKVIILAGTDAISGGIFAESPALNRDFLNQYPIDLFLPGNPPHPLTIINGLLDLTGRK